MSAIFRRCGCRDSEGRQYGVLPVTNPTPAQKAKACPLMLTDAKHGTFSWRLSNGYDRRTGTRRRINGATYATRKDAEKALNGARVAKDQGKLTGGTPTLAAYCQEYLRRRTTTGKPLAVTTAFNYERWIRQYITVSGLGKMRLDKITRKDVRGWVDDMTKAGRGAPTVARVLVVLSSIFSMAVDDEAIALNPASRVKPLAVEKAPLQVWEPGDVIRFLTTASEHRLGPVFEFLLHTALRRGEVCGLRWSDVDLDKATTRISNTRVKLDATTVEKGTKSDASAAEVELSDAALEALRVWRLRQDLERQEWGEAWTESGYVVTMEDGRPVDPDYLTKLFGKLVVRTEKAKRAEVGAPMAALFREQQPDLSEVEITNEVNRRLDKAGVSLPHLSLHGLRHTAASYAWDETGDLLAVSKMLRHASTKTTEAVYVHMRQGKQRATFGAISDALKRATGHTMDHTSPLAG
jgi:integrase